MKQFTKSFICILLLCGATMLKGSCSTGTCSVNSDCNDCSASQDCGACHSLIMPRSANDNTARRIEEHWGHLFDADCFNGGASLAFEFQQTFKGHRIAECLFGGTNTLHFVGSENVSTFTTDCGRKLIADNFGISPFANSSMTFNPRMRNYVLDFNFGFFFDEWCNGLYFKLDSPFVHTQWDLRAACGSTGCTNNTCSTGCSNSCGVGCSTGCSVSNCNNSCDSSVTCTLVTTPFPAGCVNLIAADGTTLVTTAQYLAAAVTPASNIQQALGGDFLFGQMQTKWKYGRFNSCRQSDSKLSDIELILGYDFWNCEDYHVGLFLRAVAPTGTELDSCWARDFFNPVIGNGRHWELGGGLSAHAELWNCNDDHVITMYIDGNVTHMFSNCQVRSFDFNNNGCMSRYMLLKEFNRSSSGVYSYANNLINAINFNTRRADVSIDVKGDASIKFVWRHCGWRFGLGYNIYGRSAEDVCIKTGFVDDTLKDRSFGIKGCAPVQAFGNATTGTTPNQILANTTSTRAANVRTLVSTQSKATMDACGAVDSAFTLNNTTGGGGFVYLDGCKESAIPANGVNVSTLDVAQDSLTGGAISAVGAVTGTNAPVILSGDASELDARSGAAPRQLTNKVFGTIDYEWSDCDWTPYLGIGAEGEFASHSDCCSINQWGVWLKGGLSY